jgi:hypothetical protein
VNQRSFGVPGAAKASALNTSFAAYCWRTDPRRGRL